MKAIPRAVGARLAGRVSVKLAPSPQRSPPSNLPRNRAPWLGVWAAVLLTTAGVRLQAAVGLALTSVEPPTVHERAGAVTLTVQRTGPPGESASVDFRTTDGTAMAGRDFAPTRGTLWFGPEDRFKTIVVSLFDTSAPLDKASFRVLLENLSSGAYLAGPGELWVTILDDAATAPDSLEFAARPALVVAGEGEGSALLSVVRSGAGATAISVRFATANGSARADEDYLPQDAWLDFGPGETRKTIVVPIVHDRVAEGDETFMVGLMEATGGAVLGVNRNDSVQVSDDDAPAVLEPGFRPGRGLDDRVRALVRQPDGRLVVAGDFNFASGVRRDEVARYHPDGTLDLTFDPGPTLRGRLGLGGLALALQPDGQVIVGGDFAGTNDLRQPILVRLGADGAPDPTFVPFTSSLHRVRAIAVQGDGRLLVAGAFDAADGEALNLTRLAPDGSLDPAFALADGPPNSGFLNDRYGGGEVLALALQPDGRILIGGNFTMIGSTPRAHVARLEPDGALDRTFDPAGGANKDVGALVVQPDGKVIVAGEFSAFNGQPRWRIVRLNADGSVDPSFVPRPGANREIHALALQPNGQILIGGEFTEVDGVPRGRLARLHSDGSLDAEFNAGTGADEEVRALAWAPDAVYAGGDFALFHGLELNGLARLRLEGPAPDTVSLRLGAYAVREDAGQARLTVRRHGASEAALTVPFTTVSETAGPYEYAAQSGTIAFGPLESEHTIAIALRDDPVVEDAKSFTVQLGEPQGGVLGTHPSATVTLIDNETPAVLDPTFVSPGLVPQVQAMALQPDGCLLLGGAFGIQYPGQGQTFRLLARLKPDGSPDPGFVPTLFGSPLRTMLLLPDGQILVGGQFLPNGLVRFQPDGARDPGFASPTFDDEVRVLARTRHDRLLVGGDFTHVDGVERKRIVRLTANGAYDPTFDPGSGANDQVLAIVEQPDGRVVIAGRFTKVQGVRRPYIARLEADGQLDSSFSALPNDRIRSVVLLPEGRLLIGGRFTEVDGVSRLYLARLNPEGSLDPTFAPAAIDEEVRSLARLSDGRLLIAGEFASVGGFARNRVARLNPDGSLDALFQPGSGADGTVWAVLPLADGRVLIGGEFGSVAGKPCPAVARLNAEQPPALEALAPVAGGATPLLLHGVPPNTYELLASTNLVEWRSLGRRQISVPVTVWPDPDAARSPSRFYRAARVPSGD